MNRFLYLCYINISLSFLNLSFLYSSLVVKSMLQNINSNIDTYRPKQQQNKKIKSLEL